MAKQPTPEELAAEKRLIMLTYVLLSVGWLMAMGIMYGLSQMTR